LRPTVLDAFAGSAAKARDESPEGYATLTIAAPDVLRPTGSTGGLYPDC